LSAFQALKKANELGMMMFKRTAKPWRQARDAQGAIPGKNQDWAAFGVLLQRYRADVIHFLYRMVQDVTVAEELALEVFLQPARRCSPQPGCFVLPPIWRWPPCLANNALLWSCTSIIRWTMSKSPGC
jgi:hypothetical protein